MKFSSILRSIISASKGAERTSKKRSKESPNPGQICPYCHGTGLREGVSQITIMTMQPQRCEICGGSGRLPT